MPNRSHVVARISLNFLP